MGYYLTSFLVPLLLGASLLGQSNSVCASPDPKAIDAAQNVTYRGISVDGVEKFLGIPYGQDTSGAKRFANPEPYFFSSNSTVYDARKMGPICPQPPDFIIPLTQSEDCLNLNVVRPQGVQAHDKLPVMVWIYGGGLYTGSINDTIYNPDALVHQSVEKDTPIIFVAMNYRLNIFGFALSEALRTNNSLNVGLKDQRLALEWVQKNIEFFGGDPERVTIFGQSSGGLSVGIQILAYGGTRPVPFHAGIMESTALEPTSTSNFSLVAYNGVAQLAGCNTFGDPQSPGTLACLRALPFEDLLNFTITQHDSTADQNDGDIYLPTVDDDFLPQASSELARQGLFPKIPIIIGWTNNDAASFTPSTIQTPADTFSFVQLYWQGLTNDSIATILSLYPSADFPAHPSTNHSSEFYRSAQIFRDILFTCPSFYLGSAMAQKYFADGEDPKVFYYNQNQTILQTDVDAGLGVTHTSELAYVFSNFSAWDAHPTKSDIELQKRESGSWISFAYTGAPSVAKRGTLEGWKPAYMSGNATDASVYIIGGPNSGLSKLEAKGAKEALAKQRLKERCEFLNTPELVEQLQY